MKGYFKRWGGGVCDIMCIMCIIMIYFMYMKSILNIYLIYSHNKFLGTLYLFWSILWILYFPRSYVWMYIIWRFSLCSIFQGEIFSSEYLYKKSMCYPWLFEARLYLRSICRCITPDIVVNFGHTFQGLNPNFIGGLRLGCLKLEECLDEFPSAWILVHPTTSIPK